MDRELHADLTRRINTAGSPDEVELLRGELRQYRGEADFFRFGEMLSRREMGLRHGLFGEQATWSDEGREASQGRLKTAARIVLGVFAALARRGRPSNEEGAWTPAAAPVVHHVE